MPKNEVSDLITDQEIAFVHLILSGNMTDQRAAAAVGLNPDTAVYIKSKPCVRAYMLEQRALMQQQLVQPETEAPPPFTLGRERVLGRLWELAAMGPEVTRGSITGQVKAMSMIVAIEGLIPDRRAGSAEKAPMIADIYESAWHKKQREKTAAQPNLTHDQDAQQEDGLSGPGVEPAFGSAQDALPDPSPDLGNPAFATPGEAQSAPHGAFVPDARVPFFIPKNPFARRRL